MMKLARLLIVVFCLLGPSYGGVVTTLADDDVFDWMNADFDSIPNFIGKCVSVPEFIGTVEKSYSLDVNKSGEWIATGNYVQKDKLLQFEWYTKGIQSRPSKYKVLYRVDPRFQVPQVFIQTYDYDQDKYISDFHQYNSGKLLDYQDVPEQTFSTRIGAFDDYFNFRGRSKIAIQKNDVINITIDEEGKYFNDNSEMDTDLGGGSELSLIHTKSSMPDNKVIYSNADRWCADAIKPGSSNCSTPGVYFDAEDNWNTLLGKVDNSTFDIKKTSLSPCSNGANGADNPLCYYDKGRGITFSVGGTIIKPVEEKFVTSSSSGKDFFYYRSDVDGDLDFTTEWSIDGMYNSSGNLTQYMKDWGSLGSSYADFQQNAVGLKSNFSMNFLHFGRYFMDVEVGNSAITVPQSDLDEIEVEYKIVDSGIPSDSSSGTSISKYSRGNAPDSGYLWIRVVNANKNITGHVQVKTLNYSGTTFFSDVIYNDLVSPLRNKFNEISQTIYLKLVSNATLENIAKSMLVLYIIIYGLMFLAGATQITVNDLVVRVLKIAVVLALFGESSWTFFNDNLFEIFIEGTEYLMTSVIGLTSSADNIFGFIDPVFDKYTNSNVWLLLFVQLLQIHTGLTFFALMTMYALGLYFIALLEVIVGYCLAFLGLAVMVSLAPLFIILILFERTRSIFDNWLSTMFSYMIQPTLLLLFFLLIDQIISEQVLRTVVEACWEIIIPINIFLDLNHIGIPVSYNLSLPFLPGIPFFVPQLDSISEMSDIFAKNGTLLQIATSSLLLFTLCKLSSGLVDYVTLLVQYLTNVLAARQDGALQKNNSLIKDITDDINKFNPAIGAREFVMDKFIRQKISHIPKDTEQKEEDIDYSKVNRKEKRKDDNNSK